MRYNNLKLFMPVNNIIIPFKNKKSVGVFYVGENVEFLESYRYFDIPISNIRYASFPILKNIPKSVITKCIQELKEDNLIPIQFKPGIYNKLYNKNFFFDIDLILDVYVKRFGIKSYKEIKYYNFMNDIINIISGFPSTDFEKILLYSVNTDKSISNSYRYRKSFPIYKYIMENQKNIIFDKIIMFICNNKEKSFTLLYDKNLKNDVNKIRKYFFTVKSTSYNESLELDTTNNITSIINNVIGVDNEIMLTKLTPIVRNYIGSNIESNIDINKVDPLDIVSTSVLYHVKGNPDIAKEDISKLDKTEKQNIIKQFTDTLLPKYKPINTSNNDIIIASKPELLNDNISPKHILEKRKKDFRELLLDDLVGVFKPLEKEEIPIKVVNISSKLLRTPISELHPTIKDRYNITLRDNTGKIHKVTIDLPHLTENGTFVINGRYKVLVNQIITYPIFFYKPYYGRLETPYSVMTIHSKRTKKTSYLMIFMANYKVPLIMITSYKYGFNNTMKLFDIIYSVENKINTKRFNEYIRLPNGLYLNFKADSVAGKELMESLKFSMNKFPSKRNIELDSMDFWREVLVNETGTKNCIYTIDQTWKHIVTPVTESILKSKKDPYTMPTIIKYISNEVVNARVDDRNTVEKQRIRISEIFTHSVQKQILAAYNEFLSKRLGGDKDAVINVNSMKAFSDVVNSQNVQLLENINAVEELSMMTRITPIGIGGIPDRQSFPQRAQNIHDSYFGNIDPLDSPNGPLIGIQQHLAMGSNLSNDRGLFATRDIQSIKPSEILGCASALIPFVESDEGARVLMGSNQTKQAVPLETSEEPCTMSGFESLLANNLSDNFIKKSPLSGIVSTLDNHLIGIKDVNTGKETFIDITSRSLRSGSGKNGVSKFKPLVTMGQSVKKGELLAEGSSVTNGSITTGINACVAYMPWFGYNYEDGIVISESFASKVKSIHNVEYITYVEPDDDVIYMADLNDYISKGGILLSKTKVIYDVESYQHTRSEDGTVDLIEIYSNIPEENIPQKLLPAYTRFKKYFIALNGKYPIGEFKERGKKFEGILVKFKIEQLSKLKKGDKMNNRHGGKGVICKIEQDKNMPLLPNGDRIEVILNPLGVVNRMNTGQLLELIIGLISRELAILIKKKDRKSFESILDKVFKNIDNTQDKIYHKNLLNYIKSLNTKKYTQLVETVYNNRFLSIIIPPFKRPSNENILKTLDILDLKPRYPLLLPSINKQVAPVAVGYVYMQKLEHMAEKKLASRGVGSYVSKTMSPTAGKKRGGGQKMGEYDCYSLLGWGCSYMIEEFFGALSSDHITKNQMISSIIQTGECDFQHAVTNPVKEMLSQFLIGIHLTSL